MKIFMFLLTISPLAHAKFLWGVANSAFQVEGAPLGSDWLQWTHTPGKIADKTNADIATDFWNRYEEDIVLTQKLGAKAFRFSIAWERLQPQQGSWDEKAIDHYRRIIHCLRQHGLEPIVTLHHFVLPSWIVQQGGLLAPNFPSYFSEYMFRTIQELSKTPQDVQYWMTFNEPNVLAFSGYFDGEWPPGIKGDMKSMIKAMDQMISAHLSGYQRIADLHRPWIKIGIAQHWRDMQSKSFKPLDLLATRFVSHYFNRYFVNHLYQKGLDYIGVNYYGRTIVSASFKKPFISLGKGNGPVSDIDWEIYPQGLENVLHEIHSLYQKPLLISENGIADEADLSRSSFLKDHIEAMRRAQKSGVNVIGYLYWSLTDNFEWTRGLTPRFGLIEVDYKTLIKKPRTSYFIYQHLIEQNSEH